MQNSLQIGDLKLHSRLSLAPMAGITDFVLRDLVRSFSPNCLLTTEMISSEALVIQAKKKSLGSLFSEFEGLKCSATNLNNEFSSQNPLNRHSPVAYQLVGHKPDLMVKSAKILSEIADIIDINMGCPVNKVVKSGDGCALMRTPELASDIVKAIKDTTQKPVSVKFRLGWSNEEKNYLEFAHLMQDSGADAITIHARTRSQMYSGHADWDSIYELKKAVNIPVFANGDVVDVKSAIECLKITQADGIAVGRGALGNVQIFEQIEHYLNTGKILEPPTLQTKIEILKLHLNKEIELRGEDMGIKFFRKFYPYYIKGVKGASQLRFQLVREENFKNIIKILDDASKALDDVSNNNLNNIFSEAL